MLQRWSRRLALTAGVAVALAAISAQGVLGIRFTRATPAAHPLGTVSAVGAQLGAQRWYKLLSYQISDHLQVQVNVANGNLVVQQKDFQVKGTGLDLAVGQHYNSLSTSTGSVGAHWVLDGGADVRLQLPGDGSAVYFGPGGFSDTFQPVSGGFADPPGLDSSLAKNANGAYTLTSHQSGEKLNFSAAGQLTSEADRNGNAISLTYDAAGHLASLADTQGRHTQFASTAAGLIGTITDSASRQYLLTYDAGGNLVRYTDPAGGVAAFAYSAASDLTQLTDPDGHAVALAYDASHRVTSITFGAGETTAFAYSGSTTTVVDPDQSRTVYTSDANGRVIQVADAQGNTSSTAYTADFSPASGSDALGSKSTLSYDALNNLSAGQLPTGAQGAALYGDSSHPFQPTSATDAQGNVTKYAYDAPGNVAQVTDALGGVTKYAYNANGTQSSTTDASGNVTTYQYDSAGNLTGVFPTGLDYAYDSLSRVVGTVDAKGQKTQYVYDALDRSTRVAYSDGSIVTQSFDADGNRTKLVDSTGTTAFAYDSLGRLVSKTLPGGEVITFAYDGAGNLTSRHDSGGTVTYRYSGVGLLASATDPTGATTSFTYDAAHQLALIAYPNGVSVKYAHDGADNVTSITAVNGAGTTLLSRQYSYTSPAGKATLQRYATTDQTGAITSYGYDAGNRLTSAVVQARLTGTTSDSRSYKYDAVGNRTSQTINGTTTSYTYNLSSGTVTAGGTTYTYDTDGNLTRRSDGTTWVYSAANFLTTVTVGGCGGPPQTNPTACPVSPNAVPNALVAEGMTYSGLDQTERVTLGGNTFVYDPTGLTRGTDATGASTSFLRDPDRRLLSQRGPAGTFYVIPDAVGSTIGLTASDGSLAASWTYDPWGNVLGTTGTATTPFLFQGGYADLGGLYKMGARYYDPATGRYTQVDNQQGSLANPTTLNRYLFQLDSPVNSPSIAQEQPSTN